MDEQARRARLRHLFEEAIELPRAEHAAFCLQRCADDQELRRRLEELLAADAGSELGGNALDRRLRAVPLMPSRFGSEVGPVDQTSTVPESIGQYRILERLGEGGCGVVYLAEQRGEVRRRVALKLIKPGMGSAEVLARFAAERQALALMDHPSVARVFDSGASEAGQPYFAMEYVAGVEIVEFANRHKLSLRRRVELMVQVCHAVQHAHGKGVIHRDLKPANVLVTTIDGLPTPKVIDFGIAKAISQPLTDQTLHTIAGRMIGTPDYMSPEQADGCGADVDIRTDVYALGVLLYELLTGQRPLELRDACSAGLAEVVRTIRETVPQRPSTRILAAATGRGLSPYGASTASVVEARRLRGDLDWITMKALEKERDRRYETADALALDLQRYLVRDPVSAGPPGLRYRLGKFVSRNRVAVAAALTVALVLVVGIVVSVLALLSARREAERSVEAVRMLAELLEVANPDVSNDSSATLAVLERTRTRLEALLPNDAPTRAPVHRVLGTAYWGQGQLAAAAGQLELALELADRNETTSRRELHDLLWPAFWVEWQRRVPSEGDLWHRLNLNLSQLVTEGLLDRDGRPVADRVTGMTWAILSPRLPLVSGYDDFVGVGTGSPEFEPDGSDRSLLYADWLVLCGDGASVIHGQHDLGRRLVLRALEIYRTRCGLKTGHSRVALATEMVLEIDDRAGDFEHGLPFAREGLRQVEAALGREHWYPQVFRAWTGTFLVRACDLDAAEPLLRKSCDELRRVLGFRHLAFKCAFDLVELYRLDGRQGLHRLEQARLLQDLSEHAVHRGVTDPVEVRAVFLPDHPEIAAELIALREQGRSLEERSASVGRLTELLRQLPLDRVEVRVQLAKALDSWLGGANAADVEDPNRLPALELAVATMEGHGRSPLFPLREKARTVGMCGDLHAARDALTRVHSLLVADPVLGRIPSIRCYTETMLARYECDTGAVEQGLARLRVTLPELRTCYGPGSDMVEWGAYHLSRNLTGEEERQEWVGTIHGFVDEVLRFEIARPCDGLCRRLLALDGLAREHYEIAARGAEHSLRLGPDRWEFLRTKGLAAYRLGNDVEAQQALRRSVASDGGAQDPTGWIFLSLSLARSGEREAADGAWQHVVECADTEPDDDDVVRFLAEAARAGFMLE